MHKLIKIPLYTFALILLGLTFGFLTFKVLSFSRTVPVPDLYGKSLVEANKILTDKGLYLKIEGEDYDSSVPSGNIIKQDVPGGNTVKERRGIKVVISKGPKVKSIPLLVNETMADAESLLIKNGLKIGKIIMVHSDQVDKDKVIAHKPGPDEPVSDNITLLVSLGPYDRIYICPDFKGMPLEQANLLIKKLNLNAATEGSGGIIESQRPEPGKQIKTGDTIYLKLI
jgi:beta-lactam-binding protein with PASTA domain